MILTFAVGSIKNKFLGGDSRIHQIKLRLIEKKRGLQIEFLYLIHKSIKPTIMENNILPSGFWMLIEAFNPDEIDSETSVEETNKEAVTDAYGFFPDASF